MADSKPRAKAPEATATPKVAEKQRKDWYEVTEGGRTFKRRDWYNEAGQIIGSEERY